MSLNFLFFSLFAAVSLTFIKLANGQLGSGNSDHHAGGVKTSDLPPLDCPEIHDPDVKSFDIVINKTSHVDICQHFDIPHKDNNLIIAVRLFHQPPFTKVVLLFFFSSIV